MENESKSTSGISVYRTFRAEDVGVLIEVGEEMKIDVKVVALAGNHFVNGIGENSDEMRIVPKGLAQMKICYPSTPGKMAEFYANVDKVREKNQNSAKVNNK
jgi:hypothetical protein